MAIKAGNLDTSLLLKACMHPFVHLFARASTTFSLLTVCVHDFLHRQANHSHSMHLTSSDCRWIRKHVRIVGWIFRQHQGNHLCSAHRHLSGWVDFNFSGTASLLTEQTTTTSPLESIYIFLPQKNHFVVLICRGKRKVLCWFCKEDAARGGWWMLLVVAERGICDRWLF